MPRRPKPPALIGGPYAAPPCEPGSSVVDFRGDRQTVAGLSAAPIPWPWAWSMGHGGRRSLILTGDLAAAVRTESAAAVAHHWGIHRHVVGDWRRLLGVGRMTAGTARLWRELAPRKLTRAACAGGGRASRRGAIR